jgi:hypothetical protein
LKHVLSPSVFLVFRRWRSWEQTTGPRSDYGKANASRNADKGGRREALRAEVRELRAMMDDHDEAFAAVREVIRADLTGLD